MAIPVHGEVTVRWCDRVCLSIINGAFNEAGIARWFVLVKQSWYQQGEPAEWAGVVDMRHWQGRTPETAELVYEAAMWATDHGLRSHIVLLERGKTNILFQLYQHTRGFHPTERDTIICQNYDEVVDELQKRGFSVSREFFPQ